MKDSVLQEILDLAVQAPSGDNTQPWKFRKVSENTIEIIAWGSKDNPIFNYKNIPTLIAIGAVIENIKNIAPNYGFEAEISLSNTLRDGKVQNEDVVASCTFSVSEKINDQSKGRILQRHTNRNEYLPKEIAKETRERIESLVTEDLVSKTLLFERGEIEEVADVVIESERTVLTYKPLHDTFFDSIRWKSPAEGEDTRGLDVKTMELVPPARAIFGLYKQWSIAKILNKLGFSNIIASENSKTYKTASGYLILSLEKMTQEGAVNLGQVLQRHWVEICNSNLAAQLTTGISFLYPQVLNKEQSIETLDKLQKDKIVQAFKKVLSVSHLPENTEFAIFMRFGYPKKEASTYSKKNKPVLE